MKVADEVWVTVALLHREQPHRSSFRSQEVLDRARTEGFTLRPGFQTHLSSHTVANRVSHSGAGYRMLYALGRGELRLYRPGDDFLPDRHGKTLPRRNDLPEQYWPLLDWYHAVHAPAGAGNVAVAEERPAYGVGSLVSPVAFEAAARGVLSRRLGVPLASGSIPGVPKRFDFISPDGTVVGDAKYFAMVGGVALPPAKFSIIGEHVWLLEKTGASTRFLVFGNDRRVPEEWLRRYGHLASGVQFFFLGDDGRLIELPEKPAADAGWHSLSASAFARDWDSAEDSVYDDVPPR